MSGHNVLNMFDTVGVLLLNVALNIVLIPIFGIAGAAWAWSIALIAYGAVRLVQVRYWVLRSTPISVRTFQTFLSGGIATVVALIAASSFGDHVRVALVGGGLALLAYAAALRFFGLDHEDRLLLEPLTSRLRRPPAATEPGAA
jgi:O-antigen/teichoic acid export membrane protein